MSGIADDVDRDGSPTPAEILAACEAIRAGWSEKERQSRRGKYVTQLSDEDRQQGRIAEAAARQAIADSLKGRRDRGEGAAVARPYSDRQNA